MKITFYKTLLGLSLLINAQVVSAQTTFEADNSNIQYTGRIDFSNPLQPTYIYPGIAIKAKFNGTGVSAIINDFGNGTDASGNFYKVLIDGSVYTEQIKAENGEQTYELANGLLDGDHTVEIMKITEGASGKSSFKGFIITGGTESLITPEALPNKKIEFIGDSWTCGFGNLSQYANGAASMNVSNYYAKNEDNYYAWGPITARSIGAQYHVTATSGRGLYRNNTGSVNNTLPKNYDNLFEDQTSVEWDHDNFQPDVISIHLGTNDMAQEEGGAAFLLDDEVFMQTYKAFIDQLLTYHPCANIIICFGNSKSDSWPTWTKQLTRLRNIGNDLVALYPENVTTLELPFTAEKWTGDPSDDCGYGDAWHPSLCSHEEMAEKLIQKINSMDINWGESGCSGLNTEEVSETTLSLYPNPTLGSLNITGLESYSNWEVYNSLGQMKLAGIGTKLEVSNLDSGIYFVKAENQTLRFIKK